eukprot:TRINITY_DN1244_c1_g1_i1.p1 TRINITY_DN1244_c1_g1~~TRINITY_DN1244_c1_g1_i1.p1  ORF type:complete len:496 (+),score=191.61 TRINITY_DN1244_c1_g1_i1:69-1556(+)
MGSPRVSLMFALLAFAGVSQAHVCLMNPPQRGGFDISTPGSNACFWPQGPCGTAPVSSPTVTLVAGTSFNVLFQQNLNHYNPGWQGTLDVSFGTGFNQTSDKDFTIVSVIPDFWAHLQASQTNFTVAVPVPATPCPHCTLRVRYVPNKPTEPIFHQCADVAITSPYVQLAGGLYAIQSPDLFSNPPVSTLVRLGNDGRATALQSLPNFYVSQGLVAADVKSQRLYFIGDTFGPLAADVAANTLYTYDVAANTFASVAIQRPFGGQWNALITTGTASNPLIVVAQVPGTAAYTFAYQVRYMMPDGSVSDPIGTIPATDTFVNFLWATFDPILQLVYVLGGDENSITSQDATLYIVNLATKAVTVTLLPGGNFTLVSLHVVPGTKTLFAFSPGETPASPLAQTNWSLVSVDPATGIATPIGQVAPWGQYAPYYGGSVYGGMTETKLFLHVFRQASGASDLVAVAPATGSTAFITGLNRGINAAVQLDNFVYLAPASS